MKSGQELNHWSAAVENFGVNRPEPPALVNLYRYFYGAINNTEDTKAIYAALETSSQVITKLRSDLSEQERKLTNANTLVSQLEAKLKGGNVNKMGTNGKMQGMEANAPAGAKGQKENEETSITNRADQEKALEVQREAQRASELASAKERVKKRIPKRTRDYSFLFAREESEMDDASRRIASEVVKLRDMPNDNHSASVVLANTLPELVPGVILKKREELIPMIVAAVTWHPDERKRQEMMYMLFNLIRVPNAQQRRVIMDGCVNLAALTGEERTGTELLPLAVEAIGSPYEERRILCADACGWLSPNVQHELRISLLLSILQQLSQDRSPQVRASAVVNLARLLVLEDKDKTGTDHRSSSSSPSNSSPSNSSLPEGNNSTSPNSDSSNGERKDENGGKSEISGEISKISAKISPNSTNLSSSTQPLLTIDPKKYTQLCEMILALLQDPDPTVLQVTRTTLMPVFGDFVERMQLLESKYLPSLLFRMRQLSANKATMDAKAAHEFDVNSEALVYLAPVLYENALLQTDFYEEVSKGFRGPKFSAGTKYVKNVSAFTEEEKLTLADRFADQLEATPADKLVSPDNAKMKEDWLVLDWILQNFIPSILSLAVDLESDNMVAMNALCNLLSTFTQEFGETFTRKAVVPKFLEKLNSELRENAKARSRVAILYLVAVVTGLDEKDVAAQLRSAVLDVSMGNNGWNVPSAEATLQTSIQLLLDQFEDHKETVLTTLAELLVHEDARVRKLLIKLYSMLLTQLSTADVTGRILPSLITMANDSDINVRCDVISIMGDLTIMIQDSNTVGRITAQLESFISDSPKFRTIQQLIKTYGKILPSIPPAFRDSFVLKQLVRLGKYAVDEDDSKRQKELAENLFDTFRALNGMSIGRDALRNHVIPGLKHLQKISDTLPLEKRNVVNNMISVMEQITSGGGGGAASSASSSSSARQSDPGSSNTSSSVSASPRRSMEGSRPANSAPPSTAEKTSTFGAFFSGWKP